MSTGLTTLSLVERIARVREQIDRAAEKAGRRSGDITLVAVSKTVDRAAVEEAYAAGVRHFGENRVQDAMRKFETPLPADAQLAMIGQLQSNKAGPAVRLFDYVESVDRPSIIDALDRHAGNAGIVMPVLVQVNVAGESQKAGCAVDEARELAANIARRSNLQLTGLMTIAPLVDNAEDVRPVFRALFSLRERLQTLFPSTRLDTLSMGMTNDFEVAIQEGATRVRIGRAVFG